MKVNHISNINFESKDYYISKQAREDAQKLLKEMKKSIKYEENSSHTSFSADILSSVTTGKKVKFTDIRYFIEPVNNAKVKNNIPDFTMQMGKNALIVNSNTGKILRFETGIFTSIKRVISKAEKYINYMLENFNNSEVVEQHRFKIAGFTQKGLKILEESRNKI